MPGLNGERWRLVSPYLDRAMEMENEERGSWLAQLRGEAPSLAAYLQELLEERASLEDERFLEGEAPRPAPAASLAGQTLGAYTLVEPIGQGGMGSVWLARRSDGRFEGTAAVKVLNAALVGRSGEERFRREGSFLARLTHPHIARLIDAGVSPIGQPYLVLEHVEGRQIDCYCDEEKLDVPARLRLFLDVLAAVAQAHANLIVHRDIKPSNVLVGTDGRVKLLDFGIAKLLEEETGGAAETALTREGGRAMTPEYAAPEQVTGGTITTATDVFALGTLLYVLLSGSHPAEAALRSTADLVKAIVDSEPQRLSAAVSRARTKPQEALEQSAALRATTADGLRRVLRGDLETIVAKALKKKPEERYVSVTAFAEDIRRYLEDQPISARPDTLEYRAAKFARRHTRGLGAAAAAIVALAAVVVFYTTRLATERDRARLQAQKAAKVSELLTGLLTGADPFADRKGKEPTVRGILDAGAERVEKELAGQTDLQAETLTVMGRVYQRLGALDKAQPLLEKGLAAARASFGPENERVAETLNDLGVLLREKGNYAAAEPTLQHALQMRRKVLGPENKLVAVTLVELGRLYSDRGLDDRAEPLYREALAIRTKALGEQDHETATSQNELALLLWRKGDLAGAESLFNRVLVTDRKTRGDDDADVSTALNNLALIALQRSDYASAESLLRESVRIGRKALGDTHPDVAIKLNNLSGALREQGKYEEAAAAIDEAFRIARPVLPPDHPMIAAYKVTLARLDLARKDAAAAEPLLRQALDVRRRALPKNDWRLGMTESLLGEALTSLGRFDEAERLLLDARATLKDVPGQQGREAKATSSRLVALYEAWGRPEKASPYRAAAARS